VGQTFSDVSTHEVGNSPGHTAHVVQSQLKIAKMTSQDEIAA
jgi:hypothetical protein